MPFEGYSRLFEGRALSEYLRLLAQCEVIQLQWDGDSERAFFEAGKFIVDDCDLLFAVWDGAVAEGLGGTGDVVDYAQTKACPILHINPITENVSRV